MDTGATEPAAEDQAGFTRRMGELAPGILYLYDLKARRGLWSNRRMVELLGHSPTHLATIAGELLERLMHPEDLARYEDHVRRLQDLPEGEAVEFEYRMQTAGGEWRWLHSIDRIVRRDAEGRAWHVLGLALDISERKETEEKLARAAEMTHFAQRAARALLYEYRPRTGEVVRTPAVEAVMGYTAEELDASKLGWRELIHPDDVGGFDAATEGALVTGTNLSLEYRVRHKAGHYVWVSDRGHVVRDAEGGIDRVVGMVADITDRKAIEEALLARERQLQTLADNCPEILTRIDPQLRHTFVSAAIERATGIPTERFIGRTNVELGMPPALCERWNAAVSQVLLSGRKAALGFAFDSPYSGPRQYESLFVPEFGADGSVQSVLGITRDITEAHAASQALRAREAELHGALRVQQDADRQKDEFLATLAHELRNPLAPLRNGLEILRRAGNLTGIGKDTREMMERQLSHLVRLVDDLLDVARISQGKVELKKARIELAEVFRHALEACRPQAELAGHRLSVTLPPSPVWLDADLTRMAQVIGNLLNNSIKYTPRGGHIDLEGQVAEGEALVVVRDDGVGIAAHMLPRVFDLFTQVDHTRAHAQGGLGIGLSLVRRLVELHGGRIEAASPGEGQGSTFTVRLPLAPR